jgi:hypothetical protein
VSKFSPEVTADGAEKPLKEQLGLQKLIQQSMVRQRNNSSSRPLILLPQHVSVIRPSSGGIQ